MRIMRPLMHFLVIAALAGTFRSAAWGNPGPEENGAETEQHRKDVRELTRAFRRHRPDVSEEVVRRVEQWVVAHPADGESLFLVARPSLVLGTRAGEHADDRVIERLKAAAATGYAPAIAYLGWEKIRGQEVAQDVTEGVALVRKAVETGDPEAHAVLGRILLNGYDGRPPARDEAMRHLEAAYKGGVVPAGSVLWNAYDAAGQGGEHLELLREAAEQGDPQAQVFLCKCYADGKYVPQDPAAAERGAASPRHRAFRSISASLLSSTCISGRAVNPKRGTGSSSLPMAGMKRRATS
jgi:hypothetical protein